MSHIRLGIAALFPLVIFSIAAAPSTRPADSRPLPGTAPLTWQDDIASRLVAGVDRFLLDETDKSVARRARFWKRDTSSADAYDKSIAPNRLALARMLGIRDERVPFDAPQLLADTRHSSLVAGGPGYEVHAIRWPAFGDVHGEGLLLVPTGRTHLADVIAIPDADQNPEQLIGLLPGVPAESQFPRRLAEAGARVIIPALIDRRLEPRNGRSRLSTREFLHRPAFELGRTLTGYEVQKVLAAVDFFATDAAGSKKAIGVAGYGEGGLIALYAAALDTRISCALVSGCFDDRRNLWQEPLDRNAFGLLDQFGGAELAAMVAPRTLIIEAAKFPELTLPSAGGAPARILTPPLADIRREFDRAKTLVPTPEVLHLATSDTGAGPFASREALSLLSHHLALTLADSPGAPPSATSTPLDLAGRRSRQLHEIDRHNQHVLAISADVRRQFMAKLDTTSPAAYEKSSAAYRRIFYDQVIGRFDYPLLPPNVRTRLAYDNPRWAGYEVVLDVFDNVIAYGILLLPKDIKPGERRPVVVCQHGLEGRPQILVSGDNQYYHDLAARLADRGYIVFAPQNLYIFGDRFRTLQRKANPIGKTLFSIITPQHQQILNFLKSLPSVDPGRIGFYGLSYGGKTAMRVPALLPEYCLSICSGDFNEWVWKNASTNSPYSYVWTGEYEIFEFDLGSTFNYAEMAALIAPRPFMVERGHFDVVAPDETVAYEFAKVRHLYAARLHLPDRCQIEWFVGPHTIHGVGTFEFLDRHLRRP